MIAVDHARDLRIWNGLVGNPSADVSDCGRYRYRLSRSWSGEANRCLFVMLNPSTADAMRDDPTIRKCAGFAKRWGFDAIDVVNLWAWRATDPAVIAHALRFNAGSTDLVGPENDAAIVAALQRARRVVCAWGAHEAVRRSPERVARVCRLILVTGVGVECVALSTTKDGHPRHPLMAPYDVAPVPFEAAR